MRQVLKKDSPNFEQYEKDRFMFSMELPEKLTDGTCSTTLKTILFCKSSENLRYCIPIDLFLSAPAEQKLLNLRLTKGRGKSRESRLLSFVARLSANSDV